MIVYPVSQGNVAKLMDEVFQECNDLRAAGQKEYSRESSNALRNFDDIARELRLEPPMVLWVYAKKHIDGIIAWITGHRSQREDVRGRINDLIVYLILLRAMVEREEVEHPEESNDGN